MWICKWKGLFIDEDNYEKTFDEENNIKYTFIFLLYGEKKYFSNIISNGQSKKKPITNYITSIEKKFNNKFEIKEVKTSLNLKNLDITNNKYSFFKKEEILIFMENSEDYVLYIDNIYNNSKTKLKLAEYKSDMTYDEILKHDSNEFIEYKDNIHTLSKGKMYILYINLAELDSFTIFMNPIYTSKTIAIKGLETSILYLEKDKSYILDFSENEINRIIKLSRETKNSEIFILNDNVIINSLNLYYKIEDCFKGKLELSVINENALIEFLFKQDESSFEILDFSKKTFSLDRKYYILQIPKTATNDIKVKLSKNENAARFSIYLGYTIPPYNYFSLETRENTFNIDKEYNFIINEQYKGDIKLMTNEFYCLMMQNFGEDVTLEVSNGAILKRLNFAIIISLAILCI